MQKINDFVTEIKGHTLEYMDDEHLYLVDGVIVPSITRLLKVKFERKYEGVNPIVLQRAAQAGTEVHEAIEMYCRCGDEWDLPEVQGFKDLQEEYGFEVVENETPVILFVDDKPIGAGRLDLVLKMDGQVGGADIKRTSSLDKDYLTYQLNLYRIAYRQCYGIEWEFLRGLHLRKDVKRFVPIPIDEDKAMELVREYMQEDIEE